MLYSDLQKPCFQDAYKQKVLQVWCLLQRKLYLHSVSPFCWTIPQDTSPLFQQPINDQTIDKHLMGIISHIPHIICVCIRVYYYHPSTRTLLIKTNSTSSQVNHIIHNGCWDADIQQLVWGWNLIYINLEKEDSLEWEVITWARAGRTGLLVCSRKPAQSPSAKTSSTDGTRSHWSIPIL